MAFRIEMTFRTFSDRNQFSNVLCFHKRPNNTANIGARLDNLSQTTSLYGNNTGLIYFEFSAYT